LGADDHVDRTPTTVIEANGKRQKITGIITLDTLKEELDLLLTQQ
jgi:hypothetical protein